MPALRRYSAALACGLLAMLAIAGTARASDAPASLAYDEKADARADLAHALTRAKRDGKGVLIVFGANWCKDCRVLDQELRRGRLARLIGQRYVVVKVDVGDFDRNLDLARAYENPVRKGIPSVAVVSADNKPVFSTQAGELASARGMGEAAIYRFFLDMPAR
jgi:thioredoxin 1